MVPIPAPLKCNIKAGIFSSEVEGKLIRLNEDEVLADGAAENEDYAIIDENESLTSFFDMSRLAVMQGGDAPEVTEDTKEYTSLRHFKIRHSNAKRKEKLLHELMSGE